MPIKEDKLERILQNEDDDFWYGELPPHQIEYFKGRIDGLKARIKDLRREIDELKRDSREKETNSLSN